MFGQIINRFSDKKPCHSQVPKLKVTQLRSYDDYLNYTNCRMESNQADFSFEKSLLPAGSKEFIYNGCCYICGEYVDFLVDFKYSYEIDGFLMPNWRERMVCPICRLNNRMRAVVHVFDLVCKPEKNSRLYITEQATALYELLGRRFPDICGSEYLEGSVSLGSCDLNGIRNEDLTRLTFDDRGFDYILSFDVFEHIPDYKNSLTECCRCLKSGGILFFSVPFLRSSEKNVVRAQIAPSGEIIHFLPPEYHGNPINPAGCLSFYHFGWEILDDLKSVGFKDPSVLVYWSKEFGYLGAEQMILMAIAP